MNLVASISGLSVELSAPVFRSSCPPTTGRSENVNSVRKQSKSVHAQTWQLQSIPISAYEWLLVCLAWSRKGTTTRQRGGRPMEGKQKSLAASQAQERAQLLASMHESIQNQALKTGLTSQRQHAGMLWQRQRFIRHLQRTGIRRNLVAVAAAAGAFCKAALHFRPTTTPFTLQYSCLPPAHKKWVGQDHPALPASSEATTLPVSHPAGSMEPRTSPCFMSSMGTGQETPPWSRFPPLNFASVQGSAATCPTSAKASRLSGGTCKKSYMAAATSRGASSGTQ